MLFIINMHMSTCSKVFFNCLLHRLTKTWNRGRPETKINIVCENCTILFAILIHAFVFFLKQSISRMRAKKKPSFWKKLDFHIGHPHIRIVIRCSRTSLVYLAKRLHRIVISPYRSFGTEHLSLFLRRFVFHIYFIITILHIKVLLVRGTSVSVFGIFSNVTSGFVFWGFTLFLSSGRFLCETKCYL